MPPAKKPVSPSARSRAAFKEPAALKRLNRSLDSAPGRTQRAAQGHGRDVSQGARDLYNDLQAFVSSARRDTGKLAKALQRDFEQAQKVAAGTKGGRARPTAAVSSRRQAPRTAAKRGTGKAS